MSTQALQRVYVRMLFDPGLVARVRDAGLDALPGVTLTPAELDWLRGCDPRLFTADALRPRRTLKALLDEFKASSALAVADTGRLATLDAFFASDAFHGAVQERRSMSLAYGDFLAAMTGADGRIAAVARIERAMAKARRGRAPTGKAVLEPPRRYVLAPHVALATTAANALEVMQAVEQVLFEIALAPVAALAVDGPRLDALAPLAPETTTLLAVRGTGDDVSLEELPEALAALLTEAASGVEGSRLVQRAEALGGDASVVAGLVADRLIVGA